MAFLDVPIERGRSVKARPQVAEWMDGSPITLPVWSIGGAFDGPTLYLQSGIHGDEITGIEVCRRAMAVLNPDKLRGNVVAVLVGNVPAFQSRSRGWPHEERATQDMNRVFPGSPSGLLTHRLANILFEEFLRCSDYGVDFHSALAGCDIAPYVYVSPDDNDSGTLEIREKMAYAVGSGMLYYRKRSAKLGVSDMSHSFGSQADDAGVPAIMVEMGESLRISWQHLDNGVNGIINMLRVLDMYEGEAKQIDGQIPFSDIVLHQADVSGIFLPTLELGAQVDEGDLIATIEPLLEGDSQEVRAKGSGTLLRLMRYGSVFQGAEVAWIAA